MTIAMVLTTAISLALVGTGLLAVRTIDRTEELYSDRVEVQVALASDVSANDTDCSQPICQGLMTTLKNSPLVESVRFESQQEAYARYKQLFAGQSLADVVRPQSLPATLRVKLSDQAAGAAAVKQAMNGQVGVRNVIDQRDVVAKLFDFLGGVRNVTFALALVQAIAALMLISNTVQVSAFTRRIEVGVMRLVGATRWYTQLPFLIEAVVTGVIGAVIASVGLLVGKFLFIDELLSGIVSNGVVPPIQVSRRPVGLADPRDDRRRDRGGHRLHDAAAVRAALIRSRTALNNPCVGPGCVGRAAGTMWWCRDGLIRSARFLDVESVAGHLLPAGGVFAFLAGHRRELFPDELFADLFPSRRGRPSVPADVVASVIVLQTLHGLSDSEAVEAVTFDLRWKAACGLAVTAPGFHPTVLTYWRRRLAALGATATDLRCGRAGGRRRPGR